MRQLGWILLLLPMMAGAQENSGIQFTQLNNWSEVLQKAKVEKKYVFVDVFATWCGPCKLMDTKIYPQQAVGEVYNKNFITVKVQMDQTKEDNLYIKNWYTDAAALKTKYNVTVFPTYLFFSPQGELVHREMGVLNADEFIALGKNALDPTKQSSSRLAQLLGSWKSGTKDYQTVPELLVLLEQTGDRSLFPLSESITREYVSYLNQLPEKELLTRDNILFLSSNTWSLTSKDQIFRIGIDYPEKINGVDNSQKIAAKLVEDIIGREEIHDNIFTDKNKLKTDHPEWKIYQKNIAKKYPFIDARKKILEQQKGYYAKAKNWTQYVRTMDEYFKSYGHTFKQKDAFWEYNSSAWYVFEATSNRKLLKRALKWSELGIQLDSTDLQIPDTKANLLYKLGRVEEAISLEENTYLRFVAIAKKYKERTGRDLEDIYFASNLEKMKKGEQTWPVIKDSSK